MGKYVYRFSKTFSLRNKYRNHGLKQTEVVKWTFKQHVFTSSKASFLMNAKAELLKEVISLDQLGIQVLYIKPD